LYYESIDSCAPASRILQFTYDAGLSVEETTAMIKAEILNQIVVFQGFLLQEATRV
jgi:hypothetical protein